MAANHELDLELDALEAALLVWLAAEPEGVSEHQLLRRLRDEAVHPGFPATLFLDSLTLFRSHFRLFHVLYRLRERLVAERGEILEISPLRIRLSARPEGEMGGKCRAIGEVDGLRDYYLERDHLLHTSAEEVEAMLGAFWRRFHAHRQRDEALRILELADPVDDGAIRLQYRRLAMQYHPDRGGDAERFRAIREAMEVLREASPTCQFHSEPSGRNDRQE